MFGLASGYGSGARKPEKYAGSSHGLRRDGAWLRTVSGLKNQMEQHHQVELELITHPQRRVGGIACSSPVHVGDTSAKRSIGIHSALRATPDRSQYGTTTWTTIGSKET
ncbi:hypothetical protein F1880_008229 [Penicillium rolfsii]|nr:hypothetical protein F1880_008229 [Penicillium rolfsii]